MNDPLSLNYLILLGAPFLVGMIIGGFATACALSDIQVENVQCRRVADSLRANLESVLDLAKEATDYLAYEPPAVTNAKYALRAAAAALDGEDA